VDGIYLRILDAPTTRMELMSLWERGWGCLFDALAQLTDADPGRAVMIRTEPHSVTQALNRQMAHYSCRIGQIVYLAKHFAAPSGQWTSPTISRRTCRVQRPGLRREKPRSGEDAPGRAKEVLAKSSTERFAEHGHFDGVDSLEPNSGESFGNSRPQM
jgi:Protein of unknown function (DUF1572)